MKEKFRLSVTVVAMPRPEVSFVLNSPFPIANHVFFNTGWSTEIQNIVIFRLGILFQCNIVDGCLSYIRLPKQLAGCTSGSR